MTTADGGQRTEDKVPTREHYLACMMLVGANAVQFCGLMDDFFNSYLLGGEK